MRKVTLIEKIAMTLICGIAIYHLANEIIGLVMRGNH